MLYCLGVRKIRRQQILCALFIPHTPVFFFAIHASVYLISGIGQQKYLIQLLLNGGDAPGVPALDDIYNLFREF